jgi:uncharacterized protein
MLNRFLTSQLREELASSPAVALLGPRQVGKTTLALQVANSIPHIYLDLESERDRGKLAQAELYLEGHLDKLVILDEVHRAPGLFPVLRGLIDKARQAGKEAGQYLLLGSASLQVLHQSGETLAGRIAYLELGPLHVFLPASKPPAMPAVGVGVITSFAPIWKETSRSLGRALPLKLCAVFGPCWRTTKVAC